MNNSTAVSERDWVDAKKQEGGWTPLLCEKCQKSFRGWKLKTVCFVCATPVFPKNKRHITRVAVRFSGVAHSLEAPYRHHHVLRDIYANNGKTFPNVQGFLDNRGKFLNRRDAMRVALAAGQVLMGSALHGYLLYSEDMW